MPRAAHATRYFSLFFSRYEGKISDSEKFAKPRVLTYKTIALGSEKRFLRSGIPIPRLNLSTISRISANTETHLTIKINQIKLMRLKGKSSRILPAIPGRIEVRNLRTAIKSKVYLSCSNLLASGSIRTNLNDAPVRQLQEKRVDHNVGRFREQGCRFIMVTTRIMWSLS